jgi:hepatic triacylglycerol lipase
VGQKTANFIKFLITNGVPMGKIHVVGFSLGAHVAGYCGKQLKQLNTELRYLTGLDPAGPLFEHFGASNRLHHTDAQVVDVIHTSKLLGIEFPLGKFQF